MRRALCENFFELILFIVYVHALCLCTMLSNSLSSASFSAAATLCFMYSLVQKIQQQQRSFAKFPLSPELSLKKASINCLFSSISNLWRLVLAISCIALSSLNRNARSCWLGCRATSCCEAALSSLLLLVLIFAFLSCASSCFIRASCCWRSCSVEGGAWTSWDSFVSATFPVPLLVLT